jgi:hypothetical protein
LNDLNSPSPAAPDVKTWIQKELEKTSLQRKQDVDQKETERRLIFIELEKEMWEIEESKLEYYLF